MKVYIPSSSLTKKRMKVKKSNWKNSETQIHKANKAEEHKNNKRKQTTQSVRKKIDTEMNHFKWQAYKRIYLKRERRKRRKQSEHAVQKLLGRSTVLSIKNKKRMTTITKWRNPQQLSPKQYEVVILDCKSEWKQKESFFTVWTQFENNHSFPFLRLSGVVPLHFGVTLVFILTQ